MTSKFGGIFESLAADDSDKRIAQRTATAVANKRVKDRFGAFLAAAESPTDRTARLNFIRAELTETVASVCNEYGGDPNQIEASILKTLISKDDEKNEKDDEEEKEVEKEYYGENAQDLLDDPPSAEKKKEKDETKSSKVANDPNWSVPPSDPGGELAPDSAYPPQDWEGPDARPFEGKNHEEFADYLDMVAGDHRASGTHSTAQDYEEAARRLRELGGQGTNLSDPAGDGGHYRNPQEYMGSVRTARRPKMCPYHREVTDISLASGDPTAGFNAMAQHAWGDNHCQGGFEGGCNFKRDMVTQSYWDTKAEQAEQRRQDRQLQQQQNSEQNSENPLHEVDPEVSGEEPGAELEFSDEGRGIDSELAEAPSAVGNGDGEMARGELEPMAASTAPMARAQQLMAAQKQAEAPRDGGGAVKTIDVEQSEGPVPEMDKGSWDPNSRGQAGKPIDTEESGSPHPTETIDPLTTIKSDRNDDFTDGTRAVTETQDLPSAGSDGDTTDKNTETIHTDTWSGNNGASPVTSEKQSASQDAHENPIRRILEEGFVPQSQIETAIRDHEGGGNPLG